MTPQGAGRHCAACQHVVIDFTQKTDAEILAVLASSAGQGCGRFGATQLNRVLQPLPAPSGTAWWQTALAATVALLSFRTLFSDFAQGQSRVHERNAPVEQVAVTPHFMAKPVEVDQPLSADEAGVIITGRVLDKQTGDGLPGVAILLKGTIRYAVTNSNGYFSLPAGKDEQKLPLIFQQLGYLSIEIPQPVKPFIEVKMEVETMGYFAPYTPKGMWQRLSLIPGRVKNAFSRD
ncbi:carboxypeptidase-like regulatory domain-containing protein [Hymenobacter sp. BT635]|uniref:Carboxypeptidase-like regulatory domain-containing protein n=1 Tax=Hymenobacter nitidus TaxID=2880929 RepID=A0ABS8ADS9_9BACT|nr:carboxypeptidase-like regulatory domain-containing protein [Hymenobacter nitidus]MCB2378570.1 carboxypeptidase-like regulatory domain-containing protein [Hymenobacter nitidus]